MKFLMLLFFMVKLKAEVATRVLKSNEYIDREGDKVTVLDLKIRAKMSQQQKEESASTKKNYKLGIYTSVEGDQLETISEKLYGTKKRASELKILNQSLAIGPQIKAGTKLRYIIREKEKIPAK